ncbi:MAG: hypothetical protein PUD71_01265 [Lachnospiraceae bacterium]|nr:hypothetical protein [Lachnospiraceae bacterium]
MIRIIIGYFLVLFDIVYQIGSQGNRADILPDFIGYLLIFWGAWKYKNGSADFKKFNISLIVAFVYSYVAYILDMYGLMSKMPVMAVTMISAASDMLKVTTIFLLTFALKSFKNPRLDIQSKRLTMVWRVILVCYIAEYVFLNFEEIEIAFFFFSKICAVTVIFYVFTSFDILRSEQKKKIGGKK